MLYYLAEIYDSDEHLAQSVFEKGSNVKIAIVGAGMAALAAVDVLKAAGCQVVVFEKSRGVGGRMSSKRVGHLLAASASSSPVSVGYAEFGAQYFTARHPLFLQQVQQWQQQGLVAPWLFVPHRYAEHACVASPDAETRFVGTPQMHSPLQQGFSHVELQLECRIVELSYVFDDNSKATSGWILTDDQQQAYGRFDAVLLTCPAEQSRQLMNGHPLYPQIPAHPLLPCWSVLLQVASPSALPVEGIFIQQGPLRWVAKQSAKPGREPFSLLSPTEGNNSLNSVPEQWMVHLSAEASQARLDWTPEQIIEFAATSLSEVLAIPLQVEAAIAHRWLYASYDDSKEPVGLLHDKTLKLALAGDWTYGGRVENAWLSGRAAAELLLKS